MLNKEAEFKKNIFLIIGIFLIIIIPIIFVSANNDSNKKEIIDYNLKNVSNKNEIFNTKEDLTNNLYIIELNKDDKKDKERLVKELKDKRVYYEYKTTMNAIVVNLSENEAMNLENNNLVKRVIKDSYKKITLDDSVPEIKGDIVRNMQNSSGSNIIGKGITIAILDTGVNYSHVNLGNCNVTQYTSGSCGDFKYGWDFINNDNDPIDDHGHGTHVTGIIKAYYPPSSIFGVAYNSTIISYKVCNSGGTCPDSAIISAIENATNYGVDIITMSLGSHTYVDEDALATSLQSAYNLGIDRKSVV